MCHPTFLINNPFKHLYSKIKVVLSLAVLFLLSGEVSFAQWLDWSEETSTRLVLSSVANSDGEEKDMWAADLDKDGDDDLIVVRKQPFSNSTQPGKTNLLLMNVGGVLTDQTTIYAPQFIDSVNFARDVFVGDFDNDTWEDVIIANTFSQQPMYYRNLGNDSVGNWLGLTNESSIRFPFLSEDSPLFCAVWGGDVTGNGFKDIYFVNYKPNSSGGIAKDYLLINNGAGVFTNESQVRLDSLRQSAFGTAVQIADVDNDGDNDIIKNTTLYSVAPWNKRGLIVLFNDGTGNFSNWQNLSPTGSPYMFEIADFNLDGKKDFYVVDDGSDYVLTVTGFVPDTSLTFTKTNLGYSNTNGFGGNVHAIDLDLDGDMDIGIADVDVDIPPCNSSRKMAIYRNDGGVFTNVYDTIVYTWADNSYDFYWLDINGDGLQDFLTGGCAGYEVYMSDNCSLAPNPSDYDGDGLTDSCDPCPANPDPNCTPSTEYPEASLDKSIARQWNELLLASIRKDFARPTVHARNLFHVSAAMWDAWAVYDTIATTFLLGKSVHGFACPFVGIPTSTNIAEDRRKAISYAAYRILKHRFVNSPQATLLYTGYDFHMDTLGYDVNFTSTDFSSGDARALGNYIAECYISFGHQDGANEQNDYGNTSYAPVNLPLNVDIPGNPDITDFNRWQPLTLDLFIDQSGNPIPGSTPEFLSPEWGQVTPFSLDESDLTINQRNGFDYLTYHDPGAPPLWDVAGGGNSTQYQESFAMVSVWSAHLDATDTTTWDISPAALGNRDTLPASVADYNSFYNYLDGGTVNVGHTVNPSTGQPYSPNMVARGDYARVLAEFWADGPDSETPPGHWFTLFNYVSDHPEQTHQYEGVGTPLDSLEWDVKGYFALGGAMHDVAIAAWGIKGWYDYIRPISAIRAMAALGQSTNPGGPSYHAGGIPLVPDYIEVVMPGDSLASDTTNIGNIKVKAWRGHSVINNVDTDEAGVGWIMAKDWVPYQRPSFVTPPFAGYISGHSTYSRAAADLLTSFTGDNYFPGGMGEFLAKQDSFLVFEDGPSTDVLLQWATYQDAADESAVSRIWGGIHPALDDIPGRKIGIEIAEDVFNKAEQYFFPPPCTGVPPKPFKVKFVSGSPKVCPGDTITFDVKPVGNATSYWWDPPTGASIVSGQGTTVITLAIDSNYIVADSVHVYAVNECGLSPYKAKRISKNNPKRPNVIIGTFEGVCANSSQSYSITPDPDPSYTYVWTAPPGAIIAQGQDSTTCTVDFLSNFTFGHLEVSAKNTCGTGFPSRRRVFSKPRIPGAMTGESYGLCNEVGVPYSVPAEPGMTYNWVAPAGIVIASGQGTNAITLDYPDSTIIGNLTVRAVNVCGHSAIRKKGIRTTPDSPASITGSTSVCAFQTNVPYQVSPVATGTTYKWTGPDDCTISDGLVTSTSKYLFTDSMNVTVNFGGTAGLLHAKAYNSCGAGKNSSLNINVTCRFAESDIIATPEPTPSLANEITEDPVVSIYPNPTRRGINISSFNLPDGDYRIMIINMLGQSQYVEQIDVSGNLLQTYIEMESLAAGIYFIDIASTKTRLSFKVIKK